MTSLTAFVSMYHNQFLNGRTQNIKHAIYDLCPQGSLAISFKKNPKTVQMQICQYLCNEQMLFTYNVCFGYLNVFFQPSTHFHDTFLLGEKTSAFISGQRLYRDV